MNQQQNAWDDLIQNWNANDDSLSKAIPSDQVLIDQINKQNRSDKVATILSLIASVVLSSYIIFEMYAGLPSVADTVLYSVFLALSISVGLFTVFSTRRSKQIPSSNTHHHIMTLISQSKGNLKAIVFSRFICVIALTISVLLVALIVFVALNKTLEIKHFLVGGVAFSCSLLFVGIYIWLKKQKTLLEHRIERLTKLDVQ